MLYKSKGTPGLYNGKLFVDLGPVRYFLDRRLTAAWLYGLMREAFAFREKDVFALEKAGLAEVIKEKAYGF